MTALVSPEVRSRAAAVPPSFSAASCGGVPPPVPTTSRRRTVPLSSMNCSDALGRVAFEALAIKCSRDGLLRATQRSETGPVLARNRQHQRIVSLGPAVGETNFHVRQSSERANVRRVL